MRDGSTWEGGHSLDRMSPKPGGEGRKIIQAPRKEYGSQKLPDFETDNGKPLQRNPTGWCTLFRRGNNIQTCKLTLERQPGTWALLSSSWPFLCFSLIFHETLYWSRLQTLPHLCNINQYPGILTWTACSHSSQNLMKAELE